MYIIYIGSAGANDSRDGHSATLSIALRNKKGELAYYDEASHEKADFPLECGVAN
jgi:hypothetical protein